MDINETLTRAASGENRLAPDQQRQFLGTFRERVSLAIPIELAQQEETLRYFPTILKEKISNLGNLSLKISSKLSLSRQMDYLKIAQEAHTPATIVEESTSQSPYGLVLHSDKALDLEDVRLVIPRESELEVSQSKSSKTSLWTKLFGK